MNAHDQWFVRCGASRVGPVSTELLLRGIREGKIPRDSEARRVDQQGWKPLMDVVVAVASASLEDPDMEDLSDEAKTIVGESPLVAQGAAAKVQPTPPSQPEPAWYVHDGRSEPMGPVTTEGLIDGLTAGWVPVSARVCAVGSTEWVPLATHPRFAEMVRKVAPPPPPAPSAIPQPVSSQPALPVQQAASYAFPAGGSPYGVYPPPQPQSHGRISARAKIILGSIAVLTLVLVVLVVLVVTAISGRSAMRSTVPASALTASAMPTADAACGPHEASIICAGSTCDRAGYCVPYCGRHDDGCGGTVDCGPCIADPSAALRKARALGICNQLQAAGVVYDCRTDREQALRLNKGIVDAAAFLFAEEANGQVGTPGFVFQFGDADAYEAMRKRLHCNDGAPCLGSLGALLIVKTVFAEAVIPDRDWSKIQGVLNQAASQASPTSTSPTIVAIPVPVHPEQAP